MADTQWQSMFDGGTCNVTIYHEGALSPGGALESQVATGEVAKGGTLSGTLNGNTYTVDVDAAGVVTLTSDDELGGWRVDVLPQYDVSALQTRIIDLDMPGDQGAGGYMYDDVGVLYAEIGTEYVHATYSGGVATPDNATFPAHDAAAPLVGVFVVGAI